MHFPGLIVVLNRIGSSFCLRKAILYDLLANLYNKRIVAKSLLYFTTISSMITSGSIIFTKNDLLLYNQMKS